MALLTLNQTVPDSWTRIDGSLSMAAGEKWSFEVRGDVGCEFCVTTDTTVPGNSHKGHRISREPYSGQSDALLHTVPTGGRLYARATGPGGESSTVVAYKEQAAPE